MGAINIVMSVICLAIAIVLSLIAITSYKKAKQKQYEEDIEFEHKKAMLEYLNDVAKSQYLTKGDSVEEYRSITNELFRDKELGND